MTVAVEDVTTMQEQADILGLELWMAISGLDFLTANPDRGLSPRRCRALNLAAKRFQVLPVVERPTKEPGGQGHLAGSGEWASEDKVLEAIRSVNAVVASLHIEDLDDDLVWRTIDSDTLRKLATSLTVVASDLDEHPGLHGQLTRAEPQA